MSSYARVDESRDCLHRAGWSVGEIATATRWLVTGANGENQIRAETPGQVGRPRARSPGRSPWGAVGELAGEVAGALVGGIAWGIWLFVGRTPR